MALAVAYLRADGRRTGARGDRAGAGLRDLPLRHGGRRRQAGAGDAARRLQLPARRGARGDHAEHAGGLPDQPEQPDRRRRCRSTRFARSPRRVPPGAVVFVDEAYAEFAGVSFIPELDALPERDRRPDVLEGVRPGRAADRLPGRRTRRRSTPIRRAVPVYSVNIAAVVAVQAALAGSRSPGRLPARRSPSRRRCSTPRATGSASRTGRAARTSCSSAPAIGPTRS